MLSAKAMIQFSSSANFATWSLNECSEKNSSQIAKFQKHSNFKDQIMFKSNNVKLLTKDEEIELSKLIEKGDLKARDRMIQANIRLAINLAKKHNHLPNADLEDLIQESYIGLIKAVDRFDWRRGYKFSTYACWWIKQSLKSYVASQSGSIRLPNHARNTLWKMQEIISNYRKEFGIEPSKEELADVLGTTVDTLQSIVACSARMVSLDDQFRNNDSDSKTSIKDSIPDESIENPEELIDRIRMTKIIKEALKDLSPREEMILRLRFGINEETNSGDNSYANA
jgi:RNA polymerase primary sigma factor